MQPLSPAVQKDFRDDLVAQSAPTFLSSSPEPFPVLSVGRGIERCNSRQAVKSYIVLKAAAATTQTQIATASTNTRIFFLGAQLCSAENGDEVYVEDANSGAITPSDNSTVGLFYITSDETNARLQMGYAARECKRGIRLQMTKTGTANTVVIVWFLEERTDGQQVSL